MRVLCLGAGGKLGRLLQAVWSRHCKTEPVWHNGRQDFDILTNQQALQDSIAQADRILLLAGVTEETPNRPFSNNIGVAKTVLVAADGKPVFLTSTAAVYGKLGGTLSETSAAPLSPYGRSKYQMEQLAQSYANATCLRIGNVAGADALLGTGQTHFTLHRFPNGGYPRRSYLGPVSLARALDHLLLLSNLPKRLNVAGPETVSMAELLIAAGKTWDDAPAPNTAIETVQLDTTQLNHWVPPLPCDPATILTELQEARAKP